MKRKDVSINKVYDARALRVVVGDKNGTLHGPAIQCCYSLLNIIHRYIHMFINIHMTCEWSSSYLGHIELPITNCILYF